MTIQDLLDKFGPDFEFRAMRITEDNHDAIAMNLPSPKAYDHIKLSLEENIFTGEFVIFGNELGDPFCYAIFYRERLFELFIMDTFEGELQSYDHTSIPISRK